MNSVNIVDEFMGFEARCAVIIFQIITEYEMDCNVVELRCTLAQLSGRIIGRAPAFSQQERGVTDAVVVATVHVVVVIWRHCKDFNA